MFSLSAAHLIISLISFMTIKSSYKFMIFSTLGIIFFFFNSSSMTLLKMGYDCWEDGKRGSRGGECRSAKSSTTITENQ